MKRGFTLAEILIFVIILGILAAIVIPQYNWANEERKRANDPNIPTTVNVDSNDPNN